MKMPIIALVFLIVLLALPNIIDSRHIHQSRSYGYAHRGHSQGRMKKAKGSRSDTVKIEGSSLPDCSHACGSCSPCTLVMVSFACASLGEAETCPMAYKCMCKHKSYPVP